MQEDWIASFQEWLRNNRTLMERENIRVEALGTTAYSPNSIYVDLFGKRGEATVQLWEDGQSDFHWLDLEAAERDPEAGVVVTHHDFHAFREMEEELKRLVERLSPEQALAAGPSSPNAGAKLVGVLKEFYDKGGREVKRAG